MELFPPWTVEARKDAQKAVSLDLSFSIDTSIVQKVLMIANIGTKCSVCHRDKNIIIKKCSRCKVRWIVEKKLKELIVHLLIVVSFICFFFNPKQYY